MEYLTKQQIILLALFVSFFSSIATGIVVVSLSDQAAPTVSQTVNRVIERTIEKASPSSETAAVAKETIIVKDDQAAVDAIAKASKAIVRITTAPGQGQYVGIGVIISLSGKIAARADAVPGAKLFGELYGGNVVPLILVSTDSETGVAVFQADQADDPKNARAYAPSVLGDSDALKLGQTVIAISSLVRLTVSTGIVSSLIQKDAAGPTSAAVEKVLMQSASSGSVDSRSVLVNLLGEVVGIRDGTDTAGNTASFTPSNIIKQYATS